MAGRPYVTSRSGRFQWLMQRVSAVLLLVLVFVHFAIQHFTEEAVTTGLTVSARFNDPYWQGFYVIMVVLGLYHGVNGLMGIAFDYAPKPLTRGIIAVVLWTLAGYFAVVGVSGIVTPQPLSEVKRHYAQHGFAAGESRGTPAIAPAVGYDFRSEVAELSMLRFYLQHHTYHEYDVSLRSAFGGEGPIATDEAEEIGRRFDQWSIDRLSLGPPRAVGHGQIFSSTYEFALWALNVRRANAEARADKAVAERLRVAPPYSPDVLQRATAPITDEQATP